MFQETGQVIIKIKTVHTTADGASFKNMRFGSDGIS